MYEPLQWRVLDPTTGLVLCETIIDSQPYNNCFLSSGKDEYNLSATWGDADQTYYANNYAECSLRQWLNAAFYDTAFTQAQKNVIVPTALDNSASISTKPAYGCAATTDSVFILPYSDVQNTSYGFASSTGSSSTREVQGSDYAKCQGLEVDSSNECSNWRLRSAGYDSGCACTVGYNGKVWFTNMTQNTHYGIRPALTLDLQPEDEISVSNTDTIGVNFRLDFDAVLRAGVDCAEVTYKDFSGNTVTKTYQKGALLVRNGKSVLTVNIAPAQLADEITVKVGDVEYVVII